MKSKIEIPTKRKGRGGARPGAGRPKGTGKYGTPTKAMRVPAEMIPDIDTFIREKLNLEESNHDRDENKEV